VQDPVSRFELDLDEVGNPTQVVTTRGGVSESVAYSYDRADRLTSACYAATACGPDAAAAGRIDYTYDLLGNRISQKRTGTAGADTTTYEHDAANQLTKETVTAGANTTVKEYAYDLNGNQVRAGADTFAYNLDNSLATATVDGTTARFAYDATGLRLSATVGEGGTATSQRWSWDVVGSLPQIALDVTTDGSGNVLEKQGFAYGPDDEPLALLDGAGGAYPYTHDWLGGVANVLTPGGLPAGGYDYDPFGNPRTGGTAGGQGPAAPGTPAAVAERNPLRYTGAYQDSTSGEGNYYLRARNYNPGTGRFSSVDPQPTGQSATSPYVYAENNPLAFTDPTGAVVDAGGGGGAAPPPQTGPTPETGPSPEDLAKAQQLQSKSMLDVILEAGGQILMEFLGINDLLNCLKGDLGACAMMVIGALPWGKIFKAKKIGEAIFRAGKAVVTFFQELKWARAVIRGAEKAAQAAKEAAAAAAKAAAEKAAKARELAERKAREAAAKAAERAKAKAAKEKAATKKSPGDCNSCKCGHSFPAGTRVLLADGSSKPIEQVEPGDTVRATDPTTGRTENRQVTRSIRTDHDKKFVNLAIRDADGKRQTITTTDNHPFWSLTRGRWIEAGQLRPGELLRTSAGTYVQVDAARHHQAARITYDLTVDAIHTYYALAGKTPLLVHNVGGDACRAAAQEMDHVTSGVLDIQVDEVPFASGHRGSGGFVDDMGRRVPGMTDSNYHHVEMQAAAYMRLNNIRQGVLYINHPDGICNFCNGLAYTRPGGTPVSPISDALPEGAAMWVYNSSGDFLGKFIGNAL
jgi:RHS repeat-associated protein